MPVFPSVCVLVAVTHHYENITTVYLDAWSGFEAAKPLLRDRVVDSTLVISKQIKTKVLIMPTT